MENTFKSASEYKKYQRGYAMVLALLVTRKHTVADIRTIVGMQCELYVNAFFLGATTALADTSPTDIGANYQSLNRARDLFHKVN